MQWMILLGKKLSASPLNLMLEEGKTQISWGLLVKPARMSVNLCWWVHRGLLTTEWEPFWVKRSQVLWDGHWVGEWPLSDREPVKSGGLDVSMVHLTRAVQSEKVWRMALGSLIQTGFVRLSLLGRWPVGLRSHEALRGNHSAARWWCQRVSFWTSASHCWLTHWAELISLARSLQLTRDKAITETKTFRNSMPLSSSPSRGLSRKSQFTLGVLPEQLPWLQCEASPSASVCDRTQRWEEGWAAGLPCHLQQDKERVRQEYDQKQKLVHGRPRAGEGGRGETWQVERQLAGRQSFEPHARFFSPGNETASCPKQYGSTYRSCRDLSTVEFSLLIHSYFTAFLVSRQCSSENLNVFICGEPSAQIFACVSWAVLKKCKSNALDLMPEPRKAAGRFLRFPAQLPADAIMWEKVAGFLRKLCHGQGRCADLRVRYLTNTLITTKCVI